MNYLEQSTSLEPSYALLEPSLLCSFYDVQYAFFALRT